MCRGKCGGRVRGELRGVTPHQPGLEPASILSNTAFPQSDVPPPEKDAVTLQECSLIIFPVR